MRTEQDANRVISLYSDTVRRICFMHVKNYSDVEDIFQNVFLKYILNDTPFESDAHEKAWLIRVTINCCKDLLRSFYRRRVVSLDDINCEQFHIDDNGKEILDAVLRLPPKYKNVVYLFYIEGYSAVEISKILGKNVNTIYTLLARARKDLRRVIEE